MTRLISHNTDHFANCYSQQIYQNKAVLEKLGTSNRQRREVIDWPDVDCLFTVMDAVPFGGSEMLARVPPCPILASYLLLQSQYSVWCNTFEEMLN